MSRTTISLHPPLRGWVAAAVLLLAAIPGRVSGQSYQMLTGINSPMNSMEFLDDVMVITGDFDCDGDLDLHGLDNALAPHYWANSGAGVFTDVAGGALDPFSGLPGGSPMWDHSKYLFPADYDGDGDTDILTTRYDSAGQNEYFRNDCAGGAIGFTRISGVSSPFSGIGIQDDVMLLTGDFDCDTDIDLHTWAEGGVTAGFFQNNAGVFTDKSADAAANPFFSLTDQAAFRDHAKYARPADYDGDGDLDVWAYDYDTPGDNTLFENTCAATMSPGFTAKTGAASPFNGIGTIADGISAIVGDFDGNGSVDLHTWDGTSTDNDFWANNGAGAFSKTNTTPGNPFAAMTGKAVFNDHARYVTPGIYRTGIRTEFLVARFDAAGQNNFVAASSITVSAPNGGEQVRGGANLNVTWTSFAVGGTVEIDLLDSGGSVSRSIADAETDDGSFTWNTSGIAAGNYGIRVSATSASGTNDNTDANFAIFFSGGLWTATPIDGDFDGARAARAADIDGDGDLDVLGGSANTDDLVWWTNDGTPEGTNWRETLIDGAVGGLRMVHAADLDGDGDLDALATAFTGNELAWWQNTSGNGGAWTKTSIDASIAGIFAVSTGDMDGDGDLDVLGAAFTGNKLAWWVNSGSPGRRGWVRRDIDTNFSGPVAVMPADVDGDGDMDVVSAGSTADQLAWWENTAGDGTTWTKRSIATGLDGAYAAYPADIDGDGDVDIVGAANIDDEVAWWENTSGNGTTWTKRSIATSFDGAESVWVGDVDGDGDLDVVGAANSGDEVSWWENTNGVGTTWTRHRVGAGFDGAHEVSAADIDGDGDLDFLAVAENDDDVMWWENAQAGRLAFTGTETTIDAFSNGAVEVTAADLDGDGDLDVVAAAETEDVITWYTNTAGDGSAWTEHPVAVMDGALSVFTGDVDGDGDLDVVAAADAAGEIAWFDNRAGDGSTWIETTIDDTFAGAYSIHAADVDGDGNLDVLGAARIDDEIAWWANTAGDGTTWTKHTVDDAFGNARSVFAADIDGDGDLDVVGASTDLHDIVWWENTVGNGTTWIEHKIDGSFAGAIDVYAADVDGDGDLDVLGAARTANEIAWWENKAGDGLAWTQHTVSSSFGGPWKVSAADIDSDGDIDVLGVAGGHHAVAWWENTSGDGLAWKEYIVNDSFFTNARGVAAADLDGDGDLDFLGAAQSADQIKWWANETAIRSTGFVISGTDGTGDNSGWRLLTAPCSAQTRADMVGVFITADDQVKRYDESVGSGEARWLNIASGGALPQGTGFAAFLFDDAVQGVDDEFGIAFPNCTPTSADVAVTTLDANEEWYLAGNPYMSSFDLSSLSIADFQATIKMWNPTIGSFVDLTQNAGTGDVIPVGQGFFLQRTTVGFGSTSITFDDAGKTGGDLVTGDSTVTVRVLVNGVMVSERQGQLDSQVTLPGVALSAGDNIVQAQIVDAAGNESPLSEPRTVRLDIEPPQVSNFRNTSGALSGTRRPTFAARISDILSGPDESSFELFLNSEFTNADVHFDSGTGDLEMLTQDDLANGTYEAGLLVRDIAGNETLTTTTFTIENIELIAPSGVALQPATSELLLKLEGSKSPNTGVEVLLDGVVVATTAVSAALTFEIRQTVPTLPLRSQVSAQSFDVAGNRSQNVALGQLVSDAAPPRVLQRFPTENLVSLDDAAIDVVLADTVSGIDRSTLSLTVGGMEVTPVVTGPDSALRIGFTDRAFFEALPAGTPAEVLLIADDLSQPANRLVLSWSFTVVSNAAPTWASLPRYLMREDGQLEIDLASLVGDLDHQTAILQLTAITTNTELDISLAGQVVTFTPAANYHEFGIAIELEARDPVGATALETLLLDVAPVNDVPRFVTRPDTLEVIPGQTLQELFVAEDPDVLTDGDVLRYALAFGPSEASIDSASGLFVFATPQAAVATRAQLTVTDLEAASDTIQVVLQPSVTTGVEDETLPLEFALFSAYPNPFTTTTRVPFDLPEPTQVDIIVYDAIGRQVAVLASGAMEAGHHEATWDGGRMASGLYLYRIVAGQFVETGQLMLVR